MPTGDELQKNRKINKASIIMQGQKDIPESHGDLAVYYSDGFILPLHRK